MTGSQDAARVPASEDGAESFADAYERLWPVAVRLARLLTGSSAAAEDVAQDAFLAVQRRWAGVHNPDGYVRAAVVNQARNHVRQRDRRPPQPDAGSPVTGVPEVDETWALVLRLGERQREALVLRYYCDLPLGEIAELMGCRLGTVKSTIHRGLERLRREMP